MTLGEKLLLLAVAAALFVAIGFTILLLFIGVAP